MSMSQTQSSELPLRPNMVVVNADTTSSTFDNLHANHSIINKSSYFNCAFNLTNFEGTAFHGCKVDGARFENCSLRGVHLVDCDVEGLVINGVKVGAFLKAFLQES